MSGVLCSLAVMLSPAAWAIAQSPAPVYSLPANGVWVDYRVDSITKGGTKEPGTLRISSVGSKQINQQPFRWLEFSLEISQAERKVRKLLVAERGLAQASWVGQVAEGYSRDGPDNKVSKMSAAALRGFLNMGLFEQKLEQKKAETFIETGLGKTRCSYVVARSSGKDRSLEYRGWLTPDVPFGWAKFEIFELAAPNPPRLLFRAIAHKTGTGAKSELDEVKAK